MLSPTELEKEFEQFWSLLKNSSKEQLSHHSNPDELIAIEEGKPMVGNDPVFGTNMAIILMGNSDFRLTFKFFFNYLTSTKLLKKVPTNNTPESIKKLIFDHMKEFMNLTAGFIKGHFENVGLSLPLITRGYDDIYMANAHGNEDIYNYYWSLKTASSQIVCKAELKLYNKETISNFKYTPTAPKSDAEDEELEFL